MQAWWTASALTIAFLFSCWFRQGHFNRAARSLLTLLLALTVEPQQDVPKAQHSRCIPCKLSLAQFSNGEVPPRAFLLAQLCSSARKTPQVWTSFLKQFKSVREGASAAPQSCGLSQPVILSGEAAYRGEGIKLDGNPWWEPLFAQQCSIGIVT